MVVMSIVKHVGVLSLVLRTPVEGQLVERELALSAARRGSKLTASTRMVLMVSSSVLS